MFESLSHTERMHKDTYDPPSYLPTLNNIHRRMNHIFTGGRWCYHCDHFTHFRIEVPRYNNKPTQITTNTTVFRTQLDDYHKRGVDVVFVPLVWGFYNKYDTRTTHATFLIFYTKTKQYAHFDTTCGDMSFIIKPHPPTYQVWNLSRLLLTYDMMYGPFVDEYHAIDGRHLEYINSLQDDVERPPANAVVDPSAIPVMRSGLCALLSFLVLLCCRRFAYHDPWNVAEEIRVLFMSHNRTHKEYFRKRLGLLYMGTHHKKSWLELLEHFAIVNPSRDIPGGRLCLVRTLRNSLCRRKPCHGQAFCNQHRFIMLAERWNRCKRCNCKLPLHRLGPMGDVVTL